MSFGSFLDALRGRKRVLIDDGMVVTFTRDEPLSYEEALIRAASESGQLRVVYGEDDVIRCQSPPTPQQIAELKAEWEAAHTGYPKAPCPCRLATCPNWRCDHCWCQENGGGVRLQELIAAGKVSEADMSPLEVCCKCGLNRPKPGMEHPSWHRADGF